MSAEDRIAFDEAIRAHSNEGIAFDEAIANEAIAFAARAAIEPPIVSAAVERSATVLNDLPEKNRVMEMRVEGTYHKSFSNIAAPNQGVNHVAVCAKAEVAPPGHGGQGGVTDSDARTHKKREPLSRKHHPKVSTHHAKRARHMAERGAKTPSKKSPPTSTAVKFQCM
jgi:hypothetical protein